MSRVQGRYVVRVGPADVGRRVTLRFRRPDAAPGEPAHSDAVGRLLSWQDGVAVVERRDGRRTEIPVDALVAARVIPEPT